MATWSKEAQSALKPIDKAYSAALRQIAYGLAVGERSERVLVKHVEESYRVLAAAAHDLKPWYKRSATESAIGGAMIGLSFAAPDLVSCFMAESTSRTAVSQSLVVASCLIGCLLTVHAILRGNGFFS